MFVVALCTRGWKSGAGNQRPLGLTRSVSPGYFRTLGIPLISGRDFTEQDKLDSPFVVILSNSTAKKLFPNENPIGHQILFGTDNGNGLSAEVIGVVGDVRSQQLSKSNDVEFYRPWPQRSTPFLNVLVRSATKPEATAGIVRAALNKIDNGLPILQPSTLDAIVTQSLGQERLTMTLLGVFAGIALLLAVVGNLWRRRLHRRAAYRRDWSTHGAGRADAGCTASGRAAGNESGNPWFDYWSGRNICRRPTC